MESGERKSQHRAQRWIAAAEGAGAGHGAAGVPEKTSSSAGHLPVVAESDPAQAGATATTAKQTSSLQQHIAPVDGATTALGASMASAGSAARDRAMDLSDVRLEEVVRLRLAIASGRYRISAADLADRMIASFRGGSVLRQFS